MLPGSRAVPFSNENNRILSTRSSFHNFFLPHQPLADRVIQSTAKDKAHTISSSFVLWTFRVIGRSEKTTKSRGKQISWKRTDLNCLLCPSFVGISESDSTIANTRSNRKRNWVVIVLFLGGLSRPAKIELFRSPTGGGRKESGKKNNVKFLLVM